MFTAKLRERFRGLPNISCLRMCTASPILSTPHQRGTFTTDDPILTHQNHPKFTVYFGVRYWHCGFYEFGQMFNTLDPSLWYLAYKYRVVPLPWKSSVLGLLTSSCPTPIPGDQWSFTASIVLPFLDVTILFYFQNNSLSNVWVFYYFHLSPLRAPKPHL